MSKYYNKYEKYKGKYTELKIFYIWLSEKIYFE